MSISFNLYKYKLIHPEGCLIYRDTLDNEGGRIVVPESVKNERRYSSVCGVVIQVSKMFKEQHPDVVPGDVIQFTITAPNIALPDHIHSDAANYWLLHWKDVLGVISYEDCDDRTKEKTNEILERWGLQSRTEVVKEAPAERLSQEVPCNSYDSQT